MVNTSHVYTRDWQVAYHAKRKFKADMNASIRKSKYWYGRAIHLYHEENKKRAIETHAIRNSPAERTRIAQIEYMRQMTEWARGERMRSRREATNEFIKMRSYSEATHE